MNLPKMNRCVIDSENLIIQFEGYLRDRGYKAQIAYLATAKRILQWGTAHCRNKKSISFLDIPLSILKSEYRLFESKNVCSVFHHLQRIYCEQQSAVTPKEMTPVQRELAAYDKHLKTVCGLAAATRTSRLQFVSKFLMQHSGEGEIIFQNMNQFDLMQYVAQQARGYSPGTGSVLATSIRSYLKFLQFRGNIDPHLLLGIPSPPNRRLKDYPTTMTETETRALLNAFDRTKPDGKRDYAMALCMLNLGLRSGEVAFLELTDIDWRRSIIRLRCDKNRICRELPLMNRTGNALADYLQCGRPECMSRKVFVRHTTPVGCDLVSENVRGAMRRAYKRAGLPPDWTGTHILRHTAATRMLNNGAALKEIADVLGHQSIDTTIIYTKVNTVALKTVCQAWPGACS